METKDIIKSIKDYNPGCEHVTLSTIFMKMKVDNERYNVINYGTPGTGKSFSSIQLLEDLRTGTEIILDNNTTKRGLFDLMVDYPNHDFVLDECTQITKDKATQDMIKLTMEGKPLSWIKMKSYEKAPVFNGNFILNVNHQLIDSLTDRCFVNMTLMNKKMAMDFVDTYIDNRGKAKPYAFLKYLRYKIRPADVQLTEDEINYIKSFVKRQIELGEENIGYSRRIIVRMVSYFKRVKRLFGKLDNEIKMFIEPYAATYIDNRRTPTIIETLLGEEEMDKPELIRLLATEGSYSERHARRLVDEEIIKGKLKIFGRKVHL